MNDLFRILLSYWYYKDSDLDTLLPKTFPHGIPPIFADSGAFSAMTQGGSISLKAYATWLQRYRHHFTVMANLDVIRHPVLTWEHQQRLENDYGLSPLPVFHVATPWEWLEHYVERYSYIALGVAGHPYKSYMGWLVQCFKRAKHQAVFHGFGITAWQPWRAFPWYSVDSSAWGQGFRYGSIPFFLPQQGRFIKLHLGDRAGIYAHAGALRDQGIDPVWLVERTATRAQICGWSALAYLRATQFLRAYHGPISVPQRPDVSSVITLKPPGVHHYLVDARSGLSDVQAAGVALSPPFPDQPAGPHLYCVGAGYGQGEDVGHAATILSGDGPQTYLVGYLPDRDKDQFAWASQPGTHTFLADAKGDGTNLKDGTVGVHTDLVDSYIAPLHHVAQEVRDAP